MIHFYEAQIYVLIWEVSTKTVHPWGSEVEKKPALRCSDQIQVLDYLQYDQLGDHCKQNRQTFAEQESILGTPVRSIIDEFLEKFQTAFDPPSPALFWEKCCDFFQSHDDQH